MKDIFSCNDTGYTSEQGGEKLQEFLLKLEGKYPKLKSTAKRNDLSLYFNHLSYNVHVRQRILSNQLD